MKQCVKILFGIDNIENKMNTLIEQMNSQGWELVQITSHYSRQTNWCLLFERKNNTKK